MGIVRVYRFEDWEGRGPYTGGRVIVNGSLRTQPEPYFDDEWAENLKDNGGLHFGFGSLTAVRRWFKKHHILAMQEKGFLFTVWDVADDSVWPDRTKRQVGFLKDHAVSICKAPLIHLPIEESPCKWLSSLRSRGSLSMLSTQKWSSSPVDPQTAEKFSEAFVSPSQSQLFGDPNEEVPPLDFDTINSLLRAAAMLG